MKGTILMDDPYPINGAVVGAARGALITSGVGLVATLATNFAAGTIGSALEQKIGRGTVDFRESVTSGLTNAVSGAIYGNNPLTSSGNAFFRGAGAGAATAGINNLSNAWKNRNAGLEDSGGISGITTGGLGTSPYGVSRDPRAGCGAPSPFVGNMGYLSAHGYQYKDTGTKQTKKVGFSLIDFAKDVAIGTVLGGLGSLAFYKATKPVDTIKNSTRNASTVEARGNKGGSKTIDIDLKYKKGWSAENMKEADAKLIVLSEANTLKTPVNRSGTSARAIYKKAYGNNSIPKGYDVDHIIDLQLGGSTTLDNLAPLNQSVNRSLGAQINNAIKKFPNGTSFGNFTIN